MNNPIVFFDGYCNLCDSTVQFIIKEDKKDIFRFCSIQSEKGQELLTKYQLKEVAEKTVVLLYEDKIFLMSNAILKILMFYGGYYKFFAILMKIVPTALRDIIYKFISNNRYKWFGKKETCMIPNEEIQSKFLS